MTNRAVLAAPILIITSFATELVTHTVTDVRMYVQTPYWHLIYIKICCFQCQ